MNDTVGYDEQIVTFVVVVRNGEVFLPMLLRDILAQDFPVEQMELFFVEGGSTDRTKEIIQRFIKDNSGRRIRLLNNPGKILSSGWNVALREAVGSIILRVDVHARIPRDFINKNVIRISSGESICGGFLEASKPDGFWPRLVYHADKSRFGGSVAPFRNPGKSRYVDSIAYAAYRREVFDVVGGYDERLVRNQDNEIHYRMRKSGFRFYFDPEIHSIYRGRESIVELLRQKFGNGLWVGLGLAISPFCFALRHFIPLFFALGLLFLSIISLLFSNLYWSYLPLIFLLFSYFSLALYFSFDGLHQEKGRNKWMIALLPILFFMMHIVYGIGTAFGILRIPFFIWQNKRYQLVRPII